MNEFSSGGPGDVAVLVECREQRSDRDAHRARDTFSARRQCGEGEGGRKARAPPRSHMFWKRRCGRRCSRYRSPAVSSERQCLSPALAQRFERFARLSPCCVPVYPDYLRHKYGVECCVYIPGTRFASMHVCTPRVAWPWHSKTPRAHGDCTDDPEAGVRPCYGLMASRPFTFASLHVCSTVSGLLVLAVCPVPAHQCPVSFPFLLLDAFSLSPFFSFLSPFLSPSLLSAVSPFVYIFGAPQRLPALVENRASDVTGATVFQGPQCAFCTHWHGGRRAPTLSHRGSTNPGLSANSFMLAVPPGSIVRQLRGARQGERGRRLQLDFAR